MNENMYFEKFISSGNFFDGYVPTLKSFDLQFKGKGSKIKIGKNVNFRNLKIRISGDNALLSIGDNATLDGLLQIDSGSSISIGDGATFNRKSWLTAWEGASISIGKNVLLSDCLIRTSDMHTIYDLETNLRINPPASVVIEDCVWLGERSMIYKGVNIGVGSVVGAGAVVTKSVAPYSLVAGVPAEVIRTNISWRRSLEYASCLPAKSAPIASLKMSKETLTYLNKRKLFHQICSIVESHSEKFNLQINQLPAYSKYYYARAALALGKDKKLPVQLLEEVLDKLPEHQSAKKLLSLHGSIECEK